MIDAEYKDFRAYLLRDDGEKEEVEAEIETIGEHFNNETVLLLVRFDLRRIFIWKGPKSPVRKRFISSRVGSKIQEESSKIGMHLKIVSVDAGDELVEFLNAFKVESYEVDEDDTVEDMYYIRNEDRKKMEEEAIAQKMKDKKKKKKGYYSPALGHVDKKGTIVEAAKEPQKKVAHKKPASSGQPIARRQAPVQRSPARSASSVKGFSEDQEKSILESILKDDAPEGFKRLNIIIGTSLYGAQTVISKVFGKEIESIEWNKIKEIPDGNIDLDAGKMRAYCKDNTVQAMELYQIIDGDSPAKKPAKKAEKKPAKKTAKKPTVKKLPKKSTGKRELKPIPKGE